MNSREDLRKEELKQDIEKLEEFCNYMGDLILRENERGISGFCDLCLRSVLTCAEEDLWKKKMEVKGIAELEKILLEDNKNEWED